MQYTACLICKQYILYYSLLFNNIILYYSIIRKQKTPAFCRTAYTDLQLLIDDRFHLSVTISVSARLLLPDRFSPGDLFAPRPAHASAKRAEYGNPFPLRIRFSAGRSPHAMGMILSSECPRSVSSVFPRPSGPAVPCCPYIWSSRSCSGYP